MARDIRSYDSENDIRNAWKVCDAASKKKVQDHVCSRSYMSMDYGYGRPQTAAT
jgi:hypothetical protein